MARCRCHQVRTPNRRCHARPTARHSGRRQPLLHAMLNCNKRSITANLKHPVGKEVLVGLSYQQSRCARIEHRGTNRRGASHEPASQAWRDASGFLKYALLRGLTTCAPNWLAQSGSTRGDGALPFRQSYVGRVARLMSSAGPRGRWFVPKRVSRPR